MYSPAPVFSWTGFYVGVNAGYGWAKESGTTTITGNTFGLNGATTGSNNGVNGINGGGQVGYNWQTGRVIWGLEADFQGSGQKQTTTVGCGAGCSVTEEDKLPAFGTIRGRLGFTAWDRGLLYVTGGGAWLSAKDTLSATAGGVTYQLLDMSTSKFGWTVGAGAEWMLWDRWSAKLEYLYMQADNVTGTAAIPALIGGGTITSTGRITNNVARVGLNYHF